MGIHLLRNKQRLVSGDVEYGGGGWVRQGAPSNKGVVFELFGVLLKTDANNIWRSDRVIYVVCCYAYEG